MTQASIPLVKRTKQDIIEEYEKMQDQLEDLRSTAKVVHSPAAVEAIEKAKAKTPQTIDQAFTDFQGTLRTHMTELRATLAEQSSGLENLQKAVEISRQQLDVQHHVAVAAEALDQLVAEHTVRATAFETEMERKKREFEEQMTQKKKAWDREAEEYEYQKKVKRERDQVETEEREKVLVTREAALRAQEQEIVQMKKTIEQFPKELDAAFTKQATEKTAELSQRFTHEKALLEQESGSRVRLLELTVKNLEERVTVQAEEARSLKQQAEEANAKAQTLAIKAIERPTTIVAPAAAPSGASSSYRDQTRGNG